MALRFLEGFGYADTGSHSATTAGDVLRVNWTSYSSVTIAALQSGTKGVRRWMSCGTTGNMIARLPVVSISEIWMGFRVNLAGYNRGLLQLGAGAGRIGILGVNSAGYLVWLPGANTRPDIDATARATVDIPLSTDVYVEIHVLFGGAGVGAIDFRINGAPAGSFSGIDTENNAGPVQFVEFGFSGTNGGSSTTGEKFSDIYIDDAAFHGPMEVWAQPADSAGSEADFTPSAGSNHQNVDEDGSDGDTTYNSSTVDGDVDAIAHSNSVSVDPLAIQPYAMARAVAPGAASFRVGVRADPSGTPTDSYGDTFGLGPDYDGYVGDIEVVDPDTASAWTAANANAAQTLYGHVA